MVPGLSVYCPTIQFVVGVERKHLERPSNWNNYLGTKTFLRSNFFVPSSADRSKYCAVPNLVVPSSWNPSPRENCFVFGNHAIYLKFKLFQKLFSNVPKFSQLKIAQDYHVMLSQSQTSNAPECVVWSCVAPPCPIFPRFCW